MAANSTPPLFQKGKSLLKSRQSIFFFVRKTEKFYPKSIKAMTYDMLKIPHYGSKIADKLKMSAIINKYHATKHSKIVF